MVGAGAISAVTLGGNGGAGGGALAIAVPGLGSIVTGGGGDFAVDDASSTGAVTDGDGAGVVGLAELAVNSGTGVSARRSLRSTSAYTPATRAAAQTATMAAGLSITVAI